MPDLIVALTLMLAVAVGWIGVDRLTRGVRHTSLTAAAAWAIWFQVTLSVATIATLAQSRVQAGILDQLWYLAAVSALCPFVAVLGARRGRLVEWSLFIVLPLIVVLEWPALAQLRACWNGQRLELETPALIAYLVVMAFGPMSFLPTRFSAASLVWVWLWGWEVAQFADLRAPHLDVNRVTGLLLLLFWVSGFVAVRRRRSEFGWSRVWTDFRDFYGIGWSFRVMTRINEVAQRERWPWVLTDGGLRPVSPDAPTMLEPSGDSPVDQAFRWQLKPFVDPEWIDERLSASSSASEERG